MKKKIALGTLALSLLVAGIAGAVTNVYSVTASTSPLSAGTAKKPERISLAFNYKVTEQDGMRPSPAKRYEIRFSGVRLSQKGLGVCTADQINSAGTAENCPAKSIVGSGSIRNILGATSDPSQKSLTCYLELTVFNSTKKHATLFLEGNSSADVPADKRCISDIAVAIDAEYDVRTGRNAYTSLNFDVPSTLRHPIPGLDNAVVDVQSTINNVKTKEKVGGRTLSYFSSIGGCKNNKRKVQVEFTSEDDKTSVAKTTAKCKK